MPHHAKTILILVCAVTALFLVSIALEAGPAQEVEPEAWLLLFESEQCKECPAVDILIKKLAADYEGLLAIKRLDVNKDKNYAWLVCLEEKLGDTGNDLPVVVIGRHVLGGEKEVMKGLESLIEKYLVSGEAKLPEKPTFKADARLTPRKPIYIAYFHNARCRGCDRVEYILKYIRKTSENIVVRDFDTSKRTLLELQERVSQLASIPEAKRMLSPTVFVGTKFFIKDKITDKNLQQAVKDSLYSGTSCSWEEAAKLAPAESAVIKRFESIALLAVIAAGAVDGINPCALASLIFFISCVTVAGRKGREILYVGMAFAAGTFLSYFLIGMGLLEFVSFLSVSPLIGRLIHLGIFILVAALAIFSFLDYLKARSGAIREMTLQIPKRLKDFSRKLIRDKLHTRYIVFAAFCLAAAVSLFEFVCTGQVYLPTIIYVAGVSEYRTKALFLLAVYNLAFLLPLLGVFFITYLGASTVTVVNVFTRNIAHTKLALTALFAIFAIYMLFLNLEEWGILAELSP